LADRRSRSELLAKKRPKLVIELRELDEIYSRFRKIFLLTNFLTILLLCYVIAHLLFPKQLQVETLREVQTAGLCTLLAGSIFLVVAQWLLMRQTTIMSRQRIQELSFLDALTGVYNYRYLDRRLEEEIRVTKRFHTILSLIYIDIDNFKRVNDEFGHQVGNAVLGEIGSFLKVVGRSTDLVGRMGGDEFMIILPNTSRDEAQIVSERIRARLEQHTFNADGRKIDYLRASMGVAAYPIDAQDKESLIASADQAMYRAKQSGGNRVCI